ncbi:MAG: hypothetical protein AAFX79_08725 [Planctomycetota bacterium]
MNDPKVRAALALVVALGVAGPMRAGTANPAAPPAAQESTADEDITRKMMALAISGETAALFERLMHFDDPQREAGRALYRDYMDEYRTSVRRAMEALQAMNLDLAGGGDRDPAAFRTGIQTLTDFVDATAALGDRYVADLGDLAMDARQEAAHARVVRARTRTYALALARTDGHGTFVDLVALAAGLEPPLDLDSTTDPAAETLREYELRLAPDAERMRAIMLAIIRLQLASLAEMGVDMNPEGEAIQELEERADALLERLTDIGTGMEATTERFRRRVEGTLRPERRRAWNLAYNRTLWPEIYGPGEFEAVYEAALALPDLAADQREAIDTIRDKHEREAAPINDRWSAGQRELDELDWAAFEDPNEFVAHRTKAVERITGARGDRRALDARLAERIRELLTPEQREAMPEADAGFDEEAVLRALGGGG